MPKSALTLRELNRATLARQSLLKRAKQSVAEVTETAAGLQAQLARPPYIGLWSRLDGFTRDALNDSIRKREVIRATLMRGTIHLVTAKDYLQFRTSVQSALDRGLRSVLRDRLDRLDPTEVRELGRRFFAEPRTFDALRKHLTAENADVDERAIAYAIRCWLHLAMVPDAESEWGYHGSGEFVLADTWLDAAPQSEADVSGLVLRYLAAFGPASVADAQNWSGLSGLAPTFEALRPKLKTLADERGRELFDLPSAPRPDADTPVPIRFLPEFDNVLLGHDDRRRVIADEHRPIVSTSNLQLLPTFLVDGFVAGTWKTTRAKKKATIELSPFVKLTKRVRDELTTEADALLQFLEADAEKHEVKLAA